MNVWVQALLPVVVALVPGLWGFALYRRQRKDTTRDAMTRLLMGLAYVQIVKRGMSYIERGSITKDEFEDFQNYFYEPYKALGGNGVAERIMNDVKALPLKNLPRYFELNRPREQEYNNDGRKASGFTRTAVEQP